MLVNRQGLVGKLSTNNEGVTKKGQDINSKISNQKRANHPDCNTLGRPLGARKQSQVARVNDGCIPVDKSSLYGKQKPWTITIQHTSGCGSLASHEVYLSDSSDLDDDPHGRHESSISAAHGQTPRSPERLDTHQRHRSQRSTGKAASMGRKHANEPASALSISAVATVRRRLKRGPSRTVAVAKSAAVSKAAAAAAAAPLYLASQGPVASSWTSFPSELFGQSIGFRRLVSYFWNTHRMAAVLIMVLLAMAAASKLLLPHRQYGGSGSSSSGSSSGGEVSGAKSGISRSSGTLGIGTGAAAAVPYMDNWAHLFNGVARPAAIRAPRSSVIAAALPSVPGRMSTGSSTRSGGAVVSPLVRWWYGSPVTVGAPSGRAGSGGSGASLPSSVRPSLTAAGGGSTEKPRRTAGVTSAGLSSGIGSSGGGSVGPQAQPHDYDWRESAAVRVITIVHDGAPSPYRTSWDSLADHTAQKFEWTDPSFQMMVFRAEQLGADTGIQTAFIRALEDGAHMVTGLDVMDAAAEDFLKDPRVRSKLPGVVLFLGGSESLSRDLTQLQGGLRPLDPGSWRTALARRLPWTPDGQGLTVWDTVQLLLGRHDSDNFLFVYLVLVNQYVTTVRQVADTTKGFDLKSLICMAKNCGSKVIGCVQDAQCKSALDCLQACNFNDQVCQYRCIVSYESPLLEQFSLCILQLHNCRNLNAKPPLLPDPGPMTSFRGVPLTHGTAEELFFGWLNEPGQGAPGSATLGDRQGKPYSWLVAAGKNPAYDYFPCQHQLYYRGRSRGQVWYEPVFKVVTLDGREVWRRRVYRVRRGKVPGTFHLSVLDNGVTSNEFWRIMDCDENLEFCLFYYSGAASTAGLSYSGAVLGSPDGRMPGPQHTERLNAALRRAGIEPWELSYVKNDDCAGAPLGITGPVAPPGVTPAVA